METNVQILVVMVVYALFLFMWGLWQGRKVKNSQDFAIAGRSLSGVVASLSERATGESSWALLGLPGAAYATGLLEIWTAIGCVVGIILAWTILAWRIQREAQNLDATTFTDFIAKQHGDKAQLIRVTGSITIVFFFFFYIGAQFIGGAKTLNNLFGLDPTWGMIALVILVIPYTIYGGFRSVAYTDVIQAVVMIVTLIVTPIVGLIYIANQPDGAIYAHSITEALSKAGPQFTDLSGGLDGFGAGCLIGGSLAWMFGYLGGLPQLTTRFISIRDVKQAKIGRNVGIVWTIFAYVGALSIGWIGIAIFGPDAISDRENIMPILLTTLFPPIIVGVLVTGILAAVISTANSVLILSATELSENLIKPLQKNQHDSLRLSRIVTAVLSILALLVAFFSSSEFVYTIVGYVWAGIGCTFSVVILLTLFWKRFSGGAAVLTIVTGMLFTIVWITTGMDKIVTVRLMTFIVAAVVAVAGSYIFPRKG